MKLLRYVLAVFFAFIVLSLIGVYVNKANSNKAIDKLFNYTKENAVKDLSTYGLSNDVKLDLSYEIKQSSFFSEQGFFNLKLKDYSFEQEFSLPVTLSFYPHKTKIEVDLNQKVLKEEFYLALFNSGFVKEEYKKALLEDLDSKLTANVSIFPYYLEAVLQIDKDNQASQQVFDKNNLGIKAQKGYIFMRYKENMFDETYFSVEAQNITLKYESIDRLAFNYNQSNINTNDYKANSQLHVLNYADHADFDDYDIIFTANTKDSIYDNYKSVDFKLYGTYRNDLAKFMVDANVGLFNVNALQNNKLISQEDIEAFVKNLFKDNQIHYTLRPSHIDLKANTIDPGFNSYVHSTVNGLMNIKLSDKFFDIDNYNGKFKLQLAFDDIKDCSYMLKLLSDFEIKAERKDKNTLLFDIESSNDKLYINGNEL